MTCTSRTNERKSLSVTGTSTHALLAVTNSNKSHVYASGSSFLNVTPSPCTSMCLCLCVTLLIWLVGRQTSDRLSHAISCQGSSDSPCTHTKTRRQDNGDRYAPSFVHAHGTVLQRGHKVGEIRARLRGPDTMRSSVGQKATRGALSTQ